MDDVSDGEQVDKETERTFYITLNCKKKSCRLHRLATVNIKTTSKSLAVLFLDFYMFYQKM